MSGLLVFSRDPAPTNWLIAVIERLQAAAAPNEAAGLTALRQSVGSSIENLVVVTRSSGEQLWRAAGHRALLWDGVDEDAAIALIRSSAADVVLTGTSDIDENGNQLLWSGSKRLGVECNVVLDHPAGLNHRFRGANGGRILPDWIYVPDEIFRKRAIDERFPAERIRILGDLNLDRLHRRAAERMPEEIARLRTVWSAGPESHVVLFISECMQEMRGMGRPFDYDYDEVELFSGLLRKAAAGELPGGGRVKPDQVWIVVRPHPRDEPGKYDSVIRSHAEPSRVVVSSEGDSDLAIAAADLVVGMTSSLLYEAAALRRGVYSLLDKDLSISKSRI